MFRIISVFVIALLVFLDRIAKIAAVRAFGAGETKEFLFGLFQFRYTENTGAAFSSFADNKIVLIVFTALVIILCLFLLLTNKVKAKIPAVCLVMIVSGGIGNLIDRIANGFVVDFIEPLFMNFAVFNVADIFITCGAILLMCYEVATLIKEKQAGRSGEKEDGKAENDDR
ncbi:MAG: signal peptidase II [Clostridia bacterium]|nr:signal peptidase II [Clostridia bacterium]